MHLIHSLWKDTLVYHPGNPNPHPRPPVAQGQEKMKLCLYWNFTWHNAYESLSAINVFCCQWTPTVSFAGPRENTLIIHDTLRKDSEQVYKSIKGNSINLGTQEPIVESQGKSSAHLPLYNSPAWEGGDVGAELVVALLVGDDGHIRLQQRARGFVFCHPITLHLRHTPIEVLLSLVNASGRVSKL